MDQPGDSEPTTRSDAYGKTCMYYANLGHANDVRAFFVEWAGNLMAGNERQDYS